MAIKPAVRHPDEQPNPETLARTALPARIADANSTVQPDSCTDTHSLEIPTTEPDSLSMLSLIDLAHLLKAEKYQSHRVCYLQARLYRAQIAIARTSRLLSIARFAQQTLAECIRSEDKQSFTNLHSVLHDAAANCLDPSHIDVEPPWSQAEEVTGYPDSFVDALPREQRKALVEFLSTIRQERSHIADRLSSLTHKELLAILPEKCANKSSESVLDSSLRSASRVSRNLGYVVDSQTDLLTTSESASPLEALIQSTRILDKDTKDDTVARDIWTNVCARLVSDQKRGMEKVIPAILDVWAASSPWPGMKRIERWIGETLHCGAFVLDQPSRQSFRVRIQGRPDPNSEDEGKADLFFSQAVNSLLQLLADPNEASAIPDGAVTLCQSVHSRIQSSDQRAAFCNFVLTRWLFNSFLMDAVTLPESFGMASERFISDNARQRILREIVMRTQKAVYHALHPWKHTTPASPELVTIVQAIAGRFKDPLVPKEDVPPSMDEHAMLTQSLTPKKAGSGLSALSLSDVTTILNALYPHHRPASLISDSELARSGLESSASSLSGFSLFPTPDSSTTTLAYPCIWPHDTHKSAHAYDPDIASFPVNSLDALDAASSSVEGKRLLDLRASLDDLVVSGRFPPDRQLAILCLDDTHESPVTQAMKLRQASEPSPTPRVQAASLPHSGIGEAALRDVLPDLEEADSRNAAHRWSDEILELWLFQALDDRARQAKAHGHFALAYSYLEMSSKCEKLFATNHAGLLRSLLHKIQEESEISLQRTLARMQECESQLKFVEPALDQKGKELRDFVHRCDLLRTKMLYTADVRTSAAYDDVRSIASALKVMGKPRKPMKTRTAPPLRHWSASKVPTMNLHLKTEAQILELLSVSAEHGGPNKLSGDQSKALAAWLASEGVQNLCIAEERLQKLCMEIRKAVDNLTAESSPLWSSSLFVRHPHATSAQSGGGNGTYWAVPIANRFDALRLHTNMSLNRDTLSSAASSHPLSARSSRDYLETRSPTLTSRSSAPLWSPSMSEAFSPSSATSVGSSHAHNWFGDSTAKSAYVSRNKQDVLTDVRRQITSLLLSEVTATMFTDGSETDQAFWTGLGGELAGRHFLTLQERPHNVEQEVSAERYGFSFQGAFENLVTSFAASCDPAAKLSFLVEIDTLMGLRKPAVHCESASPFATQHSQQDTQPHKRASRLSVSDIKVDGFRKLFCDQRTRPTTILRDLQYIAALVPSIVAEQTARSSAFWHASLAITGLKREVCSIMVETADSIIAYHSNNRGHGRSASTAQQQRDSATFSTTSQTPPAEDIAKYSMADAAHLLQITAKEGDAVAQRELATLYLTDPELMDHVIAPLARPKDVFKEELESKWRKNQDPTRCDPVTMCVAHHWMSLSAKGGDALAKEYLKQREEMERLP